MYRGRQDELGVKLFLLCCYYNLCIELRGRQNEVKSIIILNHKYCVYY